MILTLLAAALLHEAPPRTAAEAELLTAPPSQFACGERRLLARFGPGRDGPVAIVDVGEGARVLPLTPWAGGDPEVRWSDGRATLTWTPGVHLMWREGDTHLMCGRAMQHEH